MRNYQTLVFGTIFMVTVICGRAQAQTIGELYDLVQSTRVVIGNNAMIDGANSEAVAFKSTLDNQLIELNLTATRLNDAVFSAVNYSALSLALKPIVANDITGVLFGNLHILLDACDVTAALIAQCNTNGCWDQNPTTPRTSFSGAFGTYIYLNLSALNPTAIGCSGATATTFFATAGQQHNLQFLEQDVTPGKGGNLNYQVAIYHRAY